MAGSVINSSAGKEIIGKMEKKSKVMQSFQMKINRKTREKKIVDTD